MYCQWGDSYLLWLLLKWFVEHVLAFEHLQYMDASLSYIGDLIIYMLLFCLLDIVDDQEETWKGYEYAPWMDLDSLSLVR